MIKKILQPFYTAYVVITFLISLFFFFPYLYVIGLANNHVSREKIRRFIRYWAKAWLWLIGMPVTIIGDMPAADRCVIVVNHISYLDTVIIFPGIPINFRVLGKIEMAKVPLLGYIYRQIVIMVARDNLESKAKSIIKMQKILLNECSIVVFPEGTFNETGNTLKSFYDGAFKVAINTQLPIQPILLLDTEQRWHYSHWWKLWPGKNRVVYLPAISVAGYDQTQVKELKQKTFDIMEMQLQNWKKGKA